MASSGDIGNNPPACSLYLEISDEKQKIAEQWPKMIANQQAFLQLLCSTENPAQNLHGDNAKQKC